MSVDTPDSGDVITIANIESMHTDVSGTINAVKQAQMGGSTLGPTQLPSLIHTAVAEEVTDFEEIYVDTTGAFDETDLSSGWSTLTGYTLNGGGSGYELPYDGFIYAYCSLRVSAFNTTDSAGSSDGNEQVWANLWYRKDSVDYQTVRNNRFINVKTALRLSGASNNDQRAVEETISIAWVEKVTAGTLNSIKINAAMNYAQIHPRNGESAIIKNGTVGFFYIPKEV